MKKLTMLAACVAVATMASSVAYAAPAVDFGGYQSVVRPCLLYTTMVSAVVRKLTLI